MQYFPAALQELTEQFARLPGIGGKTAQRLAFHMLSLPLEDAQEFANAILEAKSTVHTCPVCQNLTDMEVCSICSDDYFGSSIYGNFQLMMNICNTRCGITYENLNIESKSLTPADFSIDSGLLRWLTIIFGYAVPLAIASFGLSVYLRRRRL